jgi:hypothetical protein
LTRIDNCGTNAQGLLNRLIYIKKSKEMTMAIQNNLNTSVDIADTDQDLQILKTPQIDGDSFTPVNTAISILTAVKDSAVEGLKATNSYGFALFSSVKSLVSGLKAAVATVKALGNLAKLGLYDTTRIAANTLYYQDEEATEAAKKEGVETLSGGCKEIEEACHKTIAMLSTAYDATLSTIEGVMHTKNSLYYAGDATVKTITACYHMLPAYHASVANNACVQIEGQKSSAAFRDLENFLSTAS